MGARIVRMLFAVSLLAVGGCTAAAPVATDSGEPVNPPVGTPASTPLPAPPASAPPNQSVPPSASSPGAAPSSPGQTGTPAGEGLIWISEGGSPPGFLLPGDDALWGVVQDTDDRQIVRIDPTTNSIDTVVEGLPILPNPIHGMAVGGSIWITSWDRGVVTQYDAVTGDELAEHKVGLHPIEPVYAFEDVWLLNHDSGSVTRIDTEGEAIAATIELESGSEPRAAHAGGGLLWVADLTPTISGIDPATNTVARTIETGMECVLGVLYIAERLALASCSGGPAELFDPESGDSLGTFDEPATLVPPLEVDGRLWLPGVSDGDYVEALVALDPESLDVVDEFELGSRFTEWSYHPAFDSAWLGGWEGLVRIPAEVLRGP